MALLQLQGHRAGNSTGNSVQDVEGGRRGGSASVRLTRKLKMTTNHYRDQHLDGRNEGYVTNPKRNLRTGKLHCVSNKLVLVDNEDGGGVGEGFHDFGQKGPN